MFFLRWLTAAVVSLVVCAAAFALADYLMRGSPDVVMTASVASIATSIVMVFVLFPRKKKKK